jgi:hypothetical protein
MKYTISKYQQVYYVLQKSLRLDIFGFFGHKKTSDHAHLKRVGGLSENKSGDEKISIISYKRDIPDLSRININSTK